VSYRDAGVDIEGGDSLVERIKPACRSTARPGNDGSLGGFGGLFDLKACGYSDPVLVAGTDGVGTKLLIAIKCGAHSTIGIDLVAMSVNDVVVQGAEPLLFLDYYATSSLDQATAYDVITGIAEGCRRAGCALVGGETAEMPGMYGVGHYDLAGFCVGAVERHAMLPRRVRAGDVVLGLPSSGVHSNGYSLVRLLVERSGLDYSHPAPWNPDRTLGQALLEPTTIYVKQLLPSIRRNLVGALAHITGGGLPGNVPRVLGDDVAAQIDLSSWRLSEVFRWLRSVGPVDEPEMLRTFNCGIGMVVISSPEDLPELEKTLGEHGQPSFRIGKVIPRVENEPQVVFLNHLD
jgi:phosphoribosylformylglycinamidine cyclo-ligase